MGDVRQGNGSVGGNKKWIVALVALCAVMLGYGSFSARTGSLDMGALACRYFFYTLVIWGIFHFRFTENRGSKINAIVFAAILGSLFFGAVIGAWLYKMEVVHAYDSILKEGAQVVIAPTDLSRGMSNHSSLSPLPHGDTGESIRFLRETFDQRLAIQKDYLVEMKAIGWGSVLNAQRIKKDIKFSESKEIIRRAYALLDKYEKKNLELIDHLMARARGLAVSSEFKRGMLAGFGSDYEQFRSKTREDWELEREVLRQYENMLSLLERNKNWTIENGRFVFTAHDEYTSFTSYINRVHEIEQQQEETMKARFAKAKRSLEAAKHRNLQ